MVALGLRGKGGKHGRDLVAQIEWVEHGLEQCVQGLDLGAHVAHDAERNLKQSALGQQKKRKINHIRIDTQLSYHLLHETLARGHIVDANEKSQPQVAVRDLLLDAVLVDLHRRRLLPMSTTHTSSYHAVLGHVDRAGKDSQHNCRRKVLSLASELGSPTRKTSSAEKDFFCSLDS